MLDLREEAAMTSILKSPHVVQVHEVIEDCKYFYFVMDYLGQNSLLDLLSSEQALPEILAREIILSLFNGLTYLHSLDIVHRDIKLENLMVCPETTSQIKIIDMGFAKKCAKGDTITGVAGSPSYVAPEILKKLPYDHKCDIWSAGIVMFTLLFGVLPYHSDNQAKKYEIIKKGGLPTQDPEWNTISEEAQDLLHGLLNTDPKKRLSAKVVLNHAWFKKDLE